MRISAVALSRQNTNVTTYLPTKMQALGRNNPCAFLPEGASFKRSPRRGKLLSILGDTTVIPGTGTFSASVVCLFVCQKKCQSTVWTRWLCDEHAEKYEEEEKIWGLR